MISIDLETYGPEDLKKVGGYRYAEKAEILLLGFAYDDDPITVVDVAQGEPIPKELLSDLQNDKCPKSAFNAHFERIIFSAYFGHFLPANSWYCTMVHAAVLGFPQKLGTLMKILFPDSVDKQKDARGDALIRQFCCPHTGKNGEVYRIQPKDSPEDWNTFIEYNRQDVVTERLARKLFTQFPITEDEHNNYVIDQAINDYGCCVDLPLIDRAISMDSENKLEALPRLAEKTGLSNPLSQTQFKSWLLDSGVDVSDVTKGTLQQLAADDTTPAAVLDVVSARLALSKTSVQKYYTAKRTVNSDGRIRGLFQFYGASRTGRFAGRMVQVQNLARNTYSYLEVARDCVKNDWTDMVRGLYGDVPYVLSELIRTIFVPAPGYEFVVADYHAIEAVVAAWLTDEEWVLKEFRGDGMIYEATAAQMFHVDKLSINTPKDEHGPNYELRSKGKVASLAFQYGGGVQAALHFGADKLGMSEPEILDFVHTWRQNNPHITDYWRRAENAAKATIQDGTSVMLPHGVSFGLKKGFLRIGLPSGRHLYYMKPALEQKEAPWGITTQIVYKGIDDRHQWGDLDTWGGKLLENITQAVARDILCFALKTLHEHGIRTVMHVHDETINEVPVGAYTPDDICALMCKMPKWCQDLPLRAAGFKTYFYKKD
jgi:DNA polymerase bacteriophage-type